MPVSNEVKQKYFELLRRAFEMYGADFASNAISEQYRLIDNMMSTNPDPNSFEKYHVTYKQILNDIQEFMLPKEIGTIPIITFNNGKWVAEYFIPQRRIKAGERRDEGWKNSILGSRARYKGRAIDATNINKKLFGPNIQDNFTIINMWDQNAQNNLRLNKEQLKYLVNNTGLGLVLLDGSHVAIVPYKLVADKSVQTFYSFEFETNAANERYHRLLLDQNYEETVKQIFMERLGFKPPWKELRLRRPYSYLDGSIGGPYPVELVNTGFTLPTAIFFTYHWVNVIEPYIHTDWRKNPSHKAGLHISATIRTVSNTTLHNYLYGLRILDTIIFRPGNRRMSTDYLMSVYGGRGMFRWETSNNRLEVRYPQPRLDAGYITNQFIITAKYVSDINKLSGVELGSNIVGDLLFPSVTKRNVLDFTSEYFNFYTDHVLRLSPAEKQIFIEHAKYCVNS